MEQAAGTDVTIEKVTLPDGNGSKDRQTTVMEGIRVSNPEVHLTQSVVFFCKSQFLHKSVNLFFILVIVKDKLTDLWGS